MIIMKGRKSSGTVIYECLIFLLGNPSKIKLPSFYNLRSGDIFFWLLCFELAQEGKK